MTRGLLLSSLAAWVASIESPGLLRKGWNLGNTLESTITNPRVEWIFEAVKAKGFDWVRIPVKWDPHADIEAPYAVNIDFMDSVEETVGWAQLHGLTAMVNAHHENWLDEAGDAFNEKLKRFVAIWDQVAARFAGHADSDLVFEIMNEPNKMSVSNLNAMNMAVLAVIRKSNPMRQVHFGGLAQNGPWWISNNPDAMHIPADDPNIALTFHSYSPWTFAGDKPSIFEYTDEMAEAEDKRHKDMHTWAQKKGLRAVVVDEFGVTHFQTNHTAKLRYYAANTAAAIKHGNGYAVWDDNGWYQILNRSSQVWEEDVLANMGDFNTCVGSLLSRNTDMNDWYPQRDARASDCSWMCQQDEACSCSWFTTIDGGTCERYATNLRMI